MIGKRLMEEEEEEGQDKARFEKKKKYT